MPITIKNSAGGGVTLDSSTSSNETINLNTPVFTGNVGIGVVPETDWNTVWSVAQVGNSALASTSGNNQMSLSQNAKLTSTSSNSGAKYIETEQASQYVQENGNHNFKVAPSGTADAAISWTNAMTIDNAGKLTIPARAFEVGTFSSTGASAGVKHNIWSNNEIGIGSSVASSSGQSHYAFYNTNGQVGYIQTSSSSTIYSTSSDYRLKEDDVPMTGATERVKALRPINFAWKVDGSRVDGFFAHELAEVVPEAATGTKDAMRDEEYEVTPAVVDDEGNETTAAVMGTRSVPDMQGIDQSKLVPLLTATIQELIARIEALEGE